MNTTRFRFPAFTLIELLVVVAIIALLISILLPSLNAAREQARSVVCLSNLKQFGVGITMYSSDYRGTLPGPLHPTVYKFTAPAAFEQFAAEAGLPYQEEDEWIYERYLTTKIKDYFNDSSTRKNSVTDQVATCPTAAGVTSDDNFIQAQVYPFHYAINNTINYNDSSLSSTNRATDPPSYFGLFANSSNPPGWYKSLMHKYGPQAIENIPRASEEWMMADAWYRPKTVMHPNLRQEGTYQSEWSGNALPYFAYHRMSSGKAFYYTANASQRRTAEATWRKQKQDGYTNTIFFDGHAAPVRSKTLESNGFEVLYGFPGTVNPATPLPKTAVWK